MASNKTTNYQLNQWLRTDPIAMTDFNEDNQKLDSLIKNLETILSGRINTVNSELSSQIAALYSNMPKYTFGTYVGTGTKGQSNPKIMNFASTLGSAPKLIYISDSHHSYSMLLLNGIQSYTVAATASSYPNYITWNDTGLSWYNTYEAAFQLNANGTNYYYFAIV